MSAEHAQREPTMEEILASIRRIISEEDKPAEGEAVLDLQPQQPAQPAPPPPVAEVKAPPPQPAPKPAPPPAPEPVIAKAPPPSEIFEEVDEPPSRSLDDELLILERTPEPPPPAPKPAPVAVAPQPAPKPEWTPPMNTLVSDPVASKAAGALGRLMGSMLVSSGNTLDDVVRELLKPMLKE